MGRVLSIYDEKFGSCDGVINVSGKGQFKEIELGSGKGHKLFRIPKENLSNNGVIHCLNGMVLSSGINRKIH